MTQNQGQPGTTYLYDVKHGDELRKHEHFVSACEESIEQPLEDHHLPASIDQLLVHDRLARPLVKRPIKQEWVRANFAQLHYDVLKMHVVHLPHCLPTST